MKRRRPNFSTVQLIIAFAVTVFILAAAASSAVLLLTGRRDRTPEGGEAAAAGAKAAMVYDPLTDGSVLRLHIVANSNSERDQIVKFAVRNAVLDYELERGTLIAAPGALGAERELLEDGAGLLETVRRALRQNGADYDAQLLLGDFPFPDREYAGKLYPAGTYRALRILLGGAEGHNWWCIMFPPLCMIDVGGTSASNAGAENASDAAYPVRFESLLAKLFNRIIGGKRYAEVY